MGFLFVWTLPTDRYGVKRILSSLRLSTLPFALVRVGEKSENSFWVYVEAFGNVKLLHHSHYVHFGPLNMVTMHSDKLGARFLSS